MGTEEGDGLSIGQVLEEGMDCGGYTVGLDGEANENDVVAMAALDVLNAEEFFLEMDRIVDGTGKLLGVSGLGVIGDQSLHCVLASSDIFSKHLADIPANCKG